MTQEINSAAFEAGVASCQFHQDNLSAAGSSPAAHFSDALGRIYVTAGAVLCSPRPQAGHTQPALTLVVEDSANGSSWATVATFDFTASDQQSAAVDSPRAYLRASWADVVGTWAVDVAVKSIATPASGGGSMPVTESGYYSGGQVAAGNRPPWSILDAGTDVLDRTNPIQPLAIKDGLYIISAEVFVQGALEIAPECDLIFDYTDVAATIRGFGVDNATGFSALVSGSYVLTAGQAIRLTVTTDEFATTVELRNALVSRIGPA